MRIGWLGGGGGGGGGGGAAGVGRWVDRVQPVLDLLQSCFYQHLQRVGSQDGAETIVAINQQCNLIDDAREGHSKTNLEFLHMV